MQDGNETDPKRCKSESSTANGETKEAKLELAVSLDDTEAGVLPEHEECYRTMRDGNLHESGNSCDNLWADWSSWLKPGPLLEMSDMQLKCGDQEYKVHSFLMIERSDVIRRLFVGKHQWADKGCKVYDLTAFAAEAKANSGIIINVPLFLSSLYGNGPGGVFNNGDQLAAQNILGATFLADHLQVIRPRKWMGGLPHWTLSLALATLFKPKAQVAQLNWLERFSPAIRTWIKNELVEQAQGNVRKLGFDYYYRVGPSKGSPRSTGYYDQNGYEVAHHGYDACDIIDAHEQLAQLAAEMERGEEHAFAYLVQRRDELVKTLKGGIEATNIGRYTIPAWVQRTRADDY